MPVKKDVPVNRDRSSSFKFTEQLDGKGVVLASFSAEWSTPCLSQIRILNELSRQFNQKVSFPIINVDEKRELAALYRITSIPTSILFKNGCEIKRFVGLQQAVVLCDEINKELD
jgi:thioredoxin